MQSIFASQENVDVWTRMMKPMVQGRFEKWVSEGKPIPLFRAISDLVMTLLFHLIVGKEFAERHAEELVPLVRNYERAMQTPQTKMFPRWASAEGRFLDRVTARVKTLVDEEIERRTQSPELYRTHTDFLQHILNAVGTKYAEGITLLPLRID